MTNLTLELNRTSSMWAAYDMALDALAKRDGDTFDRAMKRFWELNAVNGDGDRSPSPHTAQGDEA